MNATKLAKTWLSQNALILDTETTGLDETAEIIEVSIIDCAGTVLLDTLVKPVTPVGPDATRIHGITNEDLACAPSWPEVLPKVAQLLAGRLAIIYNADYDTRLIRQTCERHSLPVPEFHAECAMLAYAEFWGEWNDARQDFKWQSLLKAAGQQEVTIEGQAHRALADCRTTLGVIKAMAAHKPQEASVSIGSGVVEMTAEEWIARDLQEKEEARQLRTNPQACADALVSIARGDTGGGRGASGILLSLWNDCYGANLNDSLYALDIHNTEAAFGLLEYVANGGRLYELLEEDDMLPVIEAWGNYWKFARVSDD